MRQLREQLARARRSATRQRISATSRRTRATSPEPRPRRRSMRSVPCAASATGFGARVRRGHRPDVRLESLLHRFTAQTELESRVHATRRSLSEAVAKVDWLEARLGESAPNASAGDEVPEEHAHTRCLAGASDTAWRLALEFASPVAAGRVAVVCRARMRRDGRSSCGACSPRGPALVARSRRSTCPATR